MKQDHRKKMIAPVVITVILLLYLAVYLVLLFRAAELNFWYVLLVLPLIAAGIGLVFTLRERIREIKKGEDDDLSNY